jgi:hypothetical protein
VLLATPGWPCGLLDVGSWASHQGLARVVVFRIQPGYVFHLDAADRQSLSYGQVDGEIVDSFRRHGRCLSPEALVRRVDWGSWEIRDPQRGWTYRLADDRDGLEVTVLENLGSNDLLAGKVVAPAAIREASRSVGIQFLRKLVEFAPDVVGFRLEGGGFEQVRRCIQAVRQFSAAEIVLGGPTATSHPREVLDDCQADYVFAGESEETFCQFLRLAWQHNSRDLLAEIPGLAYRYGEQTYLNTLPRDGYGRSTLDRDRAAGGPEGRRLRNLLRPVASADLLRANRLDWSLLENFQGEFDSLFFTGGRGCPGACTFCAKLHGQEVRIKSARQLLDEIEAADALVTAGVLRVSRWRLFEHVDDPSLRETRVAWAAIYDEDFFLNRRRALEFFRLWSESPLRSRYRLSLQTNPCSLLTSQGQAHAELLGWIDRLKPMVQLGAESFHPEVLARWHKRHTLPQLNTVLDALDATRQDYTVFQLLTDFDTTAEELIESLRLLIASAYRRPRMRIASSPYTIPLYDSDTRPLLEYGGRLQGRIHQFTDYEQPQPSWMEPLVAELADLADAELQWTLHLAQRDGALTSALETVLGRIRQEAEGIASDPQASAARRSRIEGLQQRARWALDQIRELRFRGATRRFGFPV